MMRTFITAMVTTGLVALTGCSSLKQHPNSYIAQPTVCVDKGWYGYHKGSGCPSAAKPVASDPTADRLAALERDRQRLADELEAARRQNGALSSRVSDLERQLSDNKADRDQLASQLAAVQSGANEADNLSSELAAAKQRIAELEAQLAAAQASGTDKDKLAAELASAKQRVDDLESQLADRDKELTGLRGDLSAETAKLQEAQRGLLRALRPEITKGDITVNLDSERLLINLASGYLFGSGEDQLKPAGADALQRVGGVLKDFPEKEVHVAGHTDNVPIKGALQKKYPSNKELSDARANGAAQALRDGGVANLTAAGHGESDPIASNNTAAGRAKNRRVEVIVK
ncbi:MAG: OmpA family protein [Nitrospira sp.]|nr:OmpA family protein [Nitrospira sp.]